MTALVVIEAVAIGLLTLVVAGLLRSHAEILRALHQLGADVGRGDAPGGRGDAPGGRGDAPGGVVPGGVPRGQVAGQVAGQAAFDLVGTAPTGEPVAFGVVGAGHDTILAFLSTGCSTCGGFWRDFADLSPHDVPGGARLIVVTKDGAEESAAKVGELAPQGVGVVMSSRAWSDYHVPVTPYFVHVERASGQVVGQGAANTWDQVRSLAGDALANRAPGRPRHGQGS